MPSPVCGLSSLQFSWVPHSRFLLASSSPGALLAPPLPVPLATAVPAAPGTPVPGAADSSAARCCPVLSSSSSFFSSSSSSPPRPSSPGKAKARRAEAEPSPRAAPGPLRERSGVAPGPLRAGATMASSIGNFFRRSLRRPGRREGKDEASAAENNPPQVPQGKVGERSSILCSGQFFFEYLVVVSLKKVSEGRYEPKISYQFPKVFSAMFLTRSNLPNLEEKRGSPRIPQGAIGNLGEGSGVSIERVELVQWGGRCSDPFPIPFQPSGRGVRLPEVFCIISCLGCFGLFSKILDEVEKRRQISMAVIYPFMQGLRESPFPAPGKSVTIKSFIPESGTELIELTRPVDAHLEHVEFQALLQRLSPPLILHIFASAVLERRLIFLAQELSVLSQCIHAVAALLYPFTWAHTYIPVVPECLLDTVCCPTPFMVGIQLRHLERVLEQPMEEALMVDLCQGKIIRAVGDEEQILPVKLQNEMLMALTKHNYNNNVLTSEQVNALVSEAFVQFFVRLVGHYPAHIKWGRGGSGAFQERSFCKALSSKSCRRFLKRFVRTNMFSLFIEEAERSRIPPEDSPTT
ncbi:DENN domain-containing protein 2D-like [Empidonax traillii]|uniref:DENN domain-containing protein 2D-like n=1 Tax=Empidonax traillii TaxID=164674 RepID=UPI000FFD6116|nr:DENN domain-containing protein 2D-like [Empidonax traillii]